ncbi:hypothetical protein Ate02nite_45540 [Paractinoplanes tereljensis]|uniref:Uncharacterized protein n=1 Tax=Paractinoplanes tereljensis TaxID=571912 RepID=A0A919NPS9_9ACTN|nr:hypothetical protein Ate02nite_45540 [Actinoplanes tereljensis]
MFTGIAFGVASWQYQIANAPTPISHFFGHVSAQLADDDGGDSVRPPEPHFYFNVSVDSDNYDPTFSGARRHDLKDRISVLIYGEMGDLRGKKISITAWEDARPTDPIALGRDLGSPIIPVEDQPGESFSQHGDQITITVPKDFRGGLGVSASWTMLRPIGAVGGGLLAMSYPTCSTRGPDFGGCSVLGGALAAGQTVINVSPPLTSPSLIRWDEKADPESASTSLGWLSLLISDSELSRARESHLFIAGALLGVAGGGLLEVLIRAVPSSRRSISIQDQQQAGTIGAGGPLPGRPQQGSVPAVPGERWAEWKRELGERRNYRPPD